MTNFSQANRLYNLGIGVIVVYCLLFAVNYLSYPLAQSPQLDARENLVIASQFDGTSRIDAPFYRAVLYPYVLSLIHPESSRPIAGLLLGLACHFANGLLVWKIAGFLWKSPASRSISAGLYLLNPASLFYSLQLMDITLGISFFLTAVLLAITRNSIARYLLSGLILGLSVVTRPHFLPAALIVPWVVILFQEKRDFYAFLIYATGTLVLVLQGMINLSLSGEFRMLPWQGAYNLYAANRPGANGLYYKQTINVSEINYMNPARAESEILYAQETGRAPPFDITEFNSFWKNKAVSNFKESPVRMLRLWAYKAYAVFNSYEQYNNLTFSYHKSRLLLLRINPLNWGVLLVFGLAGFLVLFQGNRSHAWGFLILAGSYSASLILYYASAKFRLPMVPLLAILAGGIDLVPVYLKGKRAYLLYAAVLFSGLLAFSSFAGIRDRSTYIQDELLMANANAELGNDLQAATIAQGILKRNPGRLEAQRIYTISYFNLQLTNHPQRQSLGNWLAQKALIQGSTPIDSVHAAIFAVFQWKWGDKEGAEQIWRDISKGNLEGSRLSQACLAATTNRSYVGSPDDPLPGALKAMLLEDPQPSPK